MRACKNCKKEVKKIRRQISFKQNKLLVIFALALIFAVFSAIDSVSADSSTIYVNDLNGSDDNNGTSWDYAKKSILNATGTVTDGGTINIANGIYTGINNTKITINKNINITGQSKEGTIIDGVKSSWIFIISSGKNVIIQNLTFVNGNASSGGAISNGGSLTVNNCAFTNNTVTNTSNGNAGAIYNTGNALTISNSTFTGNKAGYGGAIVSFGTWTISDCIFTNNIAGIGGAIYNSASSATVNVCTFLSNTASRGGAICNYNILTVNSSNFINNIASMNGGAIWNWNGNSTVQFSRIIGNMAGDTLNDIYNQSGLVSAELNWWGSNEDPSAKVQGLTVSKWLILTVNADPTSIYTSNNSTITADFTHDSNGGVNDPVLGHLPDGIPVSFTTTLGNISNALTLNGKALTTLNAGLNPGIAIIAAKLDNQTPISANITVIKNPKPTYAAVTYTYTQKVPYKKGWYKSWYKKWYKKWYKQGKKWRYYWTSKMKYKWKYGWLYHTITKTGTRYVPV